MIHTLFFFKKNTNYFIRNKHFWKIELFFYFTFCNFFAIIFLICLEDLPVMPCKNQDLAGCFRTALFTMYYFLSSYMHWDSKCSADGQK